MFGLSYSYDLELTDSYTSFAFGRLEVSGGVDTSITVKVAIRNTSQRAGREVVQFYVAPPETMVSIDRPVLELRAFRKTQNLAPGEEQVIQVSLDREAFAQWDDGVSGWRVSEGRYRIIAAASVAEHRSATDHVVDRGFVF